ncbi:hypothetical protein ACHAPJ_008585 [Fusarium lateritium]
MKLGKWSRLAVEDYLMVFALINFTGVVVSINEVAKNGSNYMPENVAIKLTPEERQQAIFGSKMTFVLELFTLTAIWTVKACLLFLYARLTQGTSVKQRWAVRGVAAFCAITYILVTLMFAFHWCSPTPEYWAVPVNSKKSLFNILAAVLNRYYNFSNPNSYVFLYWYVAECGVALWVGNLPLCWPVLRLAIGSKGDTSNPSYPNPSYRNSSYPEGSARRRTQGRHPLSSKPSIWAKLEDEDATRIDTPPDQGSQIELVEQRGTDLLKQPYHAEAMVSSGPQHEGNLSGRITVVTKVEVSTKQT